MINRWDVPDPDREMKDRSGFKTPALPVFDVTRDFKLGKNQDGPFITAFRGDFTNKYGRIEKEQPAATIALKFVWQLKGGSTSFEEHVDTAELEALIEKNSSTPFVTISQLSYLMKTSKFDEIRTLTVFGGAIPVGLYAVVQKNTGSLGIINLQLNGSSWSVDASEIDSISGAAPLLFCSHKSQDRAQEAEQNPLES